MDFGLRGSMLRCVNIRKSFLSKIYFDHIKTYCFYTWHIFKGVTSFQYPLPSSWKGHFTFGKTYELYLAHGKVWGAPSHRDSMEEIPGEAYRKQLSDACRRRRSSGCLRLIAPLGWESFAALILSTISVTTRWQLNSDYSSFSPIVSLTKST